MGPNDPKGRWKRKQKTKTKTGKFGFGYLYCRKIFATFLRLSGVEQEMVDLLQGRIPRNVFVRHYLRQTLQGKTKRVAIAVENLYEKIIDTG